MKVFVMKKKDITKDLKSNYPGRGFLNKTEIGKYLGMGDERVTCILHGVPNIKDGRSYRYAIDDVAERFTRYMKQEFDTGGDLNGKSSVLA